MHRYVVFYETNVFSYCDYIICYVHACVRVGAVGDSRFPEWRRSDQ